jgi:hypothetical protein
MPPAVLVTGANVRVPVVQVWPSVKVAFAQVPESAENAALVEVKAGLLKVTIPVAVKVVVPQVEEFTWFAVGHTTVLGLARSVPGSPVADKVKEPLVPWASAVLTVVVTVPTTVGVKTMELAFANCRVQVALAARISFAAQ